MDFLRKIVIQIFTLLLIFSPLVDFSYAQISDDVDVSLEVPAEVVTPPEEVSLGNLILTCSTHPEQDSWYSNNDPRCDWNKPSGVVSFSYILDQKATTTPDNYSEGSGIYKQYANITDGVWYFHLKALGSSVYNKSLHYKLNIDITPPEFDYIRFREGTSTTNRTPTLEFLATDATSGVDYYQYQISKKDFQKIISPHQVEHLNSGSHTAEVRVYDKAKNLNTGKSRIEIIALVAPKITDLTRILHLFQDVKIRGTGPENSDIILYVTSESGRDTYEWKTSTDAKGLWDYRYKKFLKPGKYEVFAKAYDDLGGESEKSNTESFLISITGITLFGMTIPLWVIIIGLALLIIILRYLIPYLMLLFPAEKSRLVVVALLRAGELLLLDKKRELSTDQPIYEFPSSKLQARETTDTAAKRIINQYVGKVDFQPKHKIDFEIADARKVIPVTLVILDYKVGEPQIQLNTGYVGHWWINLEQDGNKYFENISNGFQKQSLVELQKYLQQKH